MATSYNEAKPPDAGSVRLLHLVPRLPREDTAPFTPAELAEARFLMRALRKLIASNGCPVAQSVLHGSPALD